MPINAPCVDDSPGMASMAERRHPDGLSTRKRFVAARSFLQFLDRLLPGQHLLNLWRKTPSVEDQRGVSIWTRDVDAAAHWVAESDSDTYIARAAAARSYGTKLRVSYDRASALLFTSIDLDAATEYRNKPHLARDSKHALEIVTDLPFEPDLLISTGGGLQPIFALGPQLFQNPTDKQHARSALKSFNDAVQRLVWERHQVLLDSTPDMARLVRMPGSLNYKTDPPVEVSFVPWIDGLRIPHE